MADARSGLQIRSTVKKDGVVEVSIVDAPTPEPKPEEVIVRIDAAPINPSDQGLLFAGADVSTARASGTVDHPVVTASISPAVMKALGGRLEQSLPVGNEGAGIVIQAGSSPAAQALMGKTVAILGGAMYAQYRCIKAAQCLVLPAGTTPAEGADCFVNPLTALGMVETMRLEGHKALVHTAAASNLGQMLNKICLKDRVALVNVVRRPEHVDLLKKMGATHVCNSSSPTFMEDLADTLAATGATIAFDAIGGGRLASQILAAMEAALARSATEYSRYGTTTLKQVYLYGGLDTSPTEIVRSFGMAWAVGGWLLFPFLQKIGADGAQRLKDRVAANLKTTFASRYARTVSLAGMLSADAIAAYTRRATGEKFLVEPNAS